jgi:hypothetical protein
LAEWLCRAVDRNRAELSATGTVLLTPGTLFSSDELSRLDSLQANIPEEKVQKGDADDDHNIFVKRIRVDHPGCNPTTVNGQASEQIIAWSNAASLGLERTLPYGACPIVVANRCRPFHLRAISSPLPWVAKLLWITDFRSTIRAT